MDENNLDILNSLISSIKQIDSVLEQQILANEDSFEILNSNFQKSENEINQNGLNIDFNLNDKSLMKKQEQKNRNTLNGINNEKPINKKIITVNTKKSSNKVNNSSNKKIKNKRKIRNNSINSNSVDYISLERNKDISKDYFSDNDFRNRKKSKPKNNVHNKSLDFNVRKNYMENENKIQVNYKVNIYQRLFDIKMKNFQNLINKQKKRKCY